MWEELKKITNKFDKNDCAFIAESYFITIKK
jgi:hypothetical protein